MWVDLKTVLITGSSGYIGQHVVRALRSLGAFTVGVDVRGGEEAPDVFFECDVLDSDSQFLSSLDVLPDACLHLAWRDGFDHNSLSHMADLSKHFLLLDRIIDVGIPQIACMGSMHEIGYWEGEIDETTPCNPQSYYGIAKDALRRAFFLKASKSDVVAQWLRGFYVYGDDDQAQSIFGKLMRAAEAGEKSFPFTSGKNKYDFLPIDDFAEEIAACVMQSSIDGIINCCSGQPVPLSEQIERYIEQNDLKITLDYGTYPDRPYDSPAIWGNDKKIRAILSAKDE